MELTSQHEELKRSAIKFVDTEINPYVDQWEQDEIFPAHEASCAGKISSCSH